MLAQRAIDINLSDPLVHRQSRGPEGPYLWDRSRFRQGIRRRSPREAYAAESPPRAAGWLGRYGFFRKRGGRHGWHCA
jgi:hypothetical protein